MTAQTAQPDQDQDDMDIPTSGEVQKFNDWANPPTISDLKRHVEDTRSLQGAIVTQITEWLDNYHVRGHAAIKKSDRKSSVQPQLIRKHAEWRYPALSEPFLSTNDLFKVSPVGWQDRLGAKQNQMVLNYQFRACIDRVRFIGDYIRTGTDEGTVIVKLGWDFKQEEKTAYEPQYEYVIDPSAAQLMQELDQLKAQNYAQYMQEVPEELRMAHELSHEQDQPVRPVPMLDENKQHAGKEVTRKKTTCNKPTLEVCDNRNVIIDPTCFGDISKAQFVIHSYETSLSDLKKDGRYQNLDRINITGNAPLNEIDHANTSAAAMSGFNLQDKPRSKIVVYEYWGYWDIDKTGMVKPIVGAWVGDTLIRLEDNPFPDKALPFVVVQHLPKRRHTHGEPDGALLVDNQKIIGAVTRGMIDTMARSANGQTGMRKDMLDAANKIRYNRGEDYEFNAGVDPRQGVHQHVYPEIPQSAPLMLQMQNQDAESLTGVKSFTQGVTGNSLGEVAAGVRGALDASSKRELDMLRRYKAGLIEIARKLISYNAEFLEDTEIIRITDDDFVAIDRKDLAGSFDLELDISTAEENQAKAQELSFMLQTLGPNADPGERKIILAEIARLRKMPDLAKRIEEYQPQPDPMQQQKAQLELQLLQSEINLNNAQAQAAGSSAGLHQVKMGTEQAKQAHIKADTDQKNLDFVDQMNGTKQSQDLEKIQTTATANAQATGQAQAEKAVLDHQGAVLQHHLDSKLQKESALQQYNASKKK